MIFLFLIGSFPGFSAEEENTVVRKNNCLKCCLSKHDVCRNVYPDARACAATYEACGDTCDSEGKKPSEWIACWTEATDKEQ